MNWIKTLCEGLVGALIGAGVTLLIYSSSIEKPSGQAYDVLKELGKSLTKSNGEYYTTNSSKDNYMVAQTMFSKSNGEVIATSFYENPLLYGQSDLIKGYTYGGSNVSRITCREICSEIDEVSVKNNMSSALPKSNLIILPEHNKSSKIDGIFTKQQDDTYLTFIAFRNLLDSTQNTGVVFRDGIAKYFFEYYYKIKKQYEK